MQSHSRCLQRGSAELAHSLGAGAAFVLNVYFCSLSWICAARIWDVRTFVCAQAWTVYGFIYGWIN